MTLGSCMLCVFATKPPSVFEDLYLWRQLAPTSSTRAGRRTFVGLPPIFFFRQVLLVYCLKGTFLVGFPLLLRTSDSFSLFPQETVALEYQP